MWKIKKSALFKRQLIEFARDYKERAGVNVAERFIVAVEEAVKFIANKPLACSIYQGAQKHEDLRMNEFRKWTLKRFPHSIFFRLTNEKTILIEAMYAHRMNVQKRFPADIEI